MLVRSQGYNKSVASTACVLAFIMFCAKNFIHFACFNENSEFFGIFMTVSEIFVRKLSEMKKI